MWIVRLALSRPYTFIVMSLLILILGILAIVRTPTDVFPSINIPVVSVIWSYTGLPPEEIANRITGQFERGATTTVNDIEHMDSQSLNGMAIIKLFFQPNVKIEGAIAQVTAIAQTMLRQLPPGSTPPLIISYSASNVPILQLGLSSKVLSEQQLFDIGTSQIRTQLSTIEGASIPWPYGGKQRLIAVDLDPNALFEKGISGSQVIDAINTQNLVQPQGTAKIGDREYNIELNSSLKRIEDINDIPLKTVGGAIIYVRDVAYVHDGSSFQTNIVRKDGRRGALLTIMKSGGASTLEIVDRVLKALPQILASTPEGLVVEKTIDQSLFVRAAVDGVIREGLLAAGLTSLMILLFLGSWRSTLIVVTSIPLSILCSLVVLSALGETINLITLGGMALAVGILVDDATVEIENINRLLPQGMSLRETILLGAQQIAVPAFVATLSICIVFVPIFFLHGIAGLLFRPLAEAVVFAMLASYLLSRTLVPTLVLYLFRSQRRQSGQPETANPGIFLRLHQRFEEGFERLREAYQEILSACLRHRLLFSTGFLLVCGAVMFLVPWLGSDLFPEIDTGQIRLHIRGPTGMRVEETAALCDRVENTIRRLIPPKELKGILDNVGVPYSGINLSYSTSGTIGTSDAEILISLNPDHQAIAEYASTLRQTLSREFPGTAFYFQPAGIVNQILNFGLSAPIDIQLAGQNMVGNYAVASKLLQRIRAIPGAVDAHIHQLFDMPKFKVDVDRTRAQGIGLTQRDVANNVLTSLSNSFQTAPNFWVSPQGIVYNINAQTPQSRVDTMDQLRTLPVIGANGQEQVLDNLALVHRQAGLAVVNHYNTLPVIDILLNTQGRDLGGVADDVKKELAEAEHAGLPRGTQLIMRGQVETMRASFAGLRVGLIFSIVLVYLLMVVNFQSWTEPFIIITALPGTLAGVVWMLFVTDTTLNVPSLMGAIMSIGVATSNSILMVTFAGTQMREEGKDSIQAALAAAHTRFRPILMTALAMIIGMLPMALGMGEGGEQDAPLGRAVIGGLLFATMATLFFVPVVYSFLRRKGYRKLLDESGSA